MMRRTVLTVAASAGLVVLSACHPLGRYAEIPARLEPPVVDVGNPPVPSVPTGVLIPPDVYVLPARIPVPQSQPTATVPDPNLGIGLPG